MRSVYKNARKRPFVWTGFILVSLLFRVCLFPYKLLVAVQCTNNSVCMRGLQKMHLSRITVEICMLVHICARNDSNERNKTDGVRNKIGRRQINFRLRKMPMKAFVFGFMPKFVYKSSVLTHKCEAVE